MYKRIRMRETIVLHIPKQSSARTIKLTKENKGYSAGWSNTGVKIVE